MSGNQGDRMEETQCILDNQAFFMECNDLTNYQQYEDGLFQIFMQLYESNTIVYKGQQVRMKHYPPDFGEKTGFYHLTCENYQHTDSEADRVPSLRRCERIKWPKELIENCSENCSKILIWENIRHGKTNIILFCPELDYVVVLAKRNGYLLLTTAYPIDYENRKRDLIKEYNNYINKQRTLG